VVRGAVGASDASRSDSFQTFPVICISTAAPGYKPPRLTVQILRRGLTQFSGNAVTSTYMDCNVELSINRLLKTPKIV
jgi:hypothetical protein